MTSILIKVASDFWYLLPVFIWQRNSVKKDDSYLLLNFAIWLLLSMYINLHYYRWAFDLSPWDFGFNSICKFLGFHLKMKDLGPKLRYGKRWGRVCFRRSNISSWAAAVTEGSCTDHDSHSTSTPHSIFAKFTFSAAQQSSAPWQFGQRCHVPRAASYNWRTPNILDVNAIKWFSNTSTLVCQISQLELLFAVAGAVICACHNRPLMWSHCCFICKWLNRQQPLPDCNFAFFLNKKHRTDVTVMMMLLFTDEW